MLTMADTDIQQFLPIFAELNIPVAFLVPTPTGYGKSIMDATAPVRTLLKDAGIHDYETQGQGQDNKLIVKSGFVTAREVLETTASLYRPVTKKGDPRIWFSKLTSYCEPCNLLAIVTAGVEIFVINLSNPEIRESFINKDFVYTVLSRTRHRENAVADELRGLIQEIHNLGFIPAITAGDTAVGDTLEHALGIRRNSSRAPDYRGIELKSTRLTRNGRQRTATRSTLFSKVPDEGMTYRQLFDAYGKMQVPRGETVARFQLYETLLSSRINAYGLQFEVDNNNDKLKIMYCPNENTRNFVSSWHMQTLRESVLLKHHETFWVKALSETRSGIEFFRYDIIEHTKNPNVLLMGPLLETDKITADLAGHLEPDGKFRNHGILFKMKPEDIHLLVGEPVIYDLRQ